MTISNRSHSLNDNQAKDTLPEKLPPHPFQYLAPENGGPRRSKYADELESKYSHFSFQVKPGGIYVLSHQKAGAPQAITMEIPAWLSHNWTASHNYLIILNWLIITKEEWNCGPLEMVRATLEAIGEIPGSRSRLAKEMIGLLLDANQSMVMKYMRTVELPRAIQEHCDCGVISLRDILQLRKMNRGKVKRAAIRIEAGADAGPLLAKLLAPSTRPSVTHDSQTRSELEASIRDLRERLATVGKESAHLLSHGIHDELSRLANTVRSVGQPMQSR